MRSCVCRYSKHARHTTSFSCGWPVAAAAWPGPVREECKSETDRIISRNLLRGQRWPLPFRRITHTHTHVHVHARVQNTNTRVRKRPESTIFAAPTKSISCDRFMHLISLREIRLQRNGAAARTKRRIFGGRLNSLAWFLLLRVFEMTKFREWIAALFSDEESSNGADANRYFFALASD